MAAADERGLQPWVMTQREEEALLGAAGWRNEDIESVHNIFEGATQSQERMDLATFCNLLVICICEAVH